MSKVLRCRRVYRPLLISLALIGAVGGFYAFVLSGVADALWVASINDTQTGRTTTMTVYFHDQELYTRSSPTSDEIALVSALWTLGPLVLAVVGGALVGVLAAYVISQWLLGRNKPIVGSLH